MNQNCCFPEMVRSQIIVNFTVHILTVFRAPISGGARVACWKERGREGGMDVGSRRWKKSRTINQKKNFNKVELVGGKNRRKDLHKAAGKALLCLVPVFKCKWFF